ncbi:phosphatidylcholine:ceramide cholinephosphotransferase 2-like [Sinocyclocheilus grahami]|nr:PREDICTED: phosphatidylcholine:ceramide cholinephosphotransferase 2-like [Sinocyclocheilus grahami]
MAASHLLDEREDDKPSGGYHVMVTIEDRPRPQATPTGRTRPSMVTPSGDQVDDKSDNSKPTRLARSFRKALRKNQDYIRIIVPKSSGSRLPSEWWKTGIAFIWAGFNLILTTVMITVVHERVPDKSVSPPLPDKFFDYVPRVEWAFSVTEVNGMILVALWFIQWLFLKHRPRPQATPTGRTRPSMVTPSGDQVDDKSDNSKPTRLARSFRKALRKNQDYIRIIVPKSSGSRLPSEWWKTGIAFIWAGFNLILTTVMITVVHERVPDKSVSPPLPDKFFDYVPRVEWAFSVTEVNGMILVALWFIQWLFLKHSSLYGDSHSKIERVLQLVSGGGLSITGSHLMCGDFLYSGHTVMLTLTFLFIQEYSPRSLLWRCYHVICWLLSAVGVVCILIAHEHYSVDVVVAYFITSRLFYWYHTIANNQALRGSPHNYLNRMWWSRVFSFLEKNVKTTVPCTFSWPLSLPSACFKNPCMSYSIVQSARDE